MILPQHAPAQNVMRAAPTIIPSPSSPQLTMTPSNCALYIGELHNDVTESSLFQFIAQAGVNIISARVCRSNSTKKSLNYGYINFQCKEDAEKAMEQLNYCELMGKPVRIMHCQRDPSLRKSGKGNIIIKHLPLGIHCRMLYNIMTNIGPVNSLAIKESGEDGLNAYIQFENEEHAKTAVHALNDTLIQGKQVEVSHFVAQKENFEKRDSHEMTFVNCYVKNLPKESFSTDEQLEEYFKDAGSITSCKLVRDAAGNATGAAFVCFNDHEDAVKACEQYNGFKFDDSLGTRPMVFTRFMRKFERFQILKDKLSGDVSGSKNPLKQNNIFIKNLDNTVTDESLKDEFCKFGKVISAKVMTHANGQSKCFGFVCYEDPKDAQAAIDKKHGTYFFSKPLHCEFAQKKDERQQNLRTQYRSSPYYVSQGMPYMVKPYPHNFIPQQHPTAAAMYPLSHHHHPHHSHNVMNGGAGVNAGGPRPFKQHHHHQQQHQQYSSHHQIAAAAASQGSEQQHHMGNVNLRAQHHNSGGSAGGSHFSRQQHHHHHHPQQNNYFTSAPSNSGVQQQQQAPKKATAAAAGSSGAHSQMSAVQKEEYAKVFRNIINSSNNEEFQANQSKIIGILLTGNVDQCAKLAENPKTCLTYVSRIVDELKAAGTTRE